MKEFVIKWSNDWPRDWWWRNRHKVSFNSAEHRAASQFDVYFEYMEDQLFKKAMSEFENDKEMQERFKKDGWISKSKVDKKKNKAAFDKIDLSKL